MKQSYPHQYHKESDKDWEEWQRFKEEELKKLEKKGEKKD